MALKLKGDQTDPGPIEGGSENKEISYKVWASDNVVYGPVSLDILLDWVADGRVQPETWIFCQDGNDWQPAKSLGCLQEELSQFHQSRNLLPTPTKVGEATDHISVNYLRKFEKLANLDQSEIEQFISYCSVMKVEEGGIITKKDSPGDGFFMVLSGETKVQSDASGEETTLAGIKEGSFIGEVAMFSKTQRSADVYALKDCILLFISVEDFQEIMENKTKLAMKLLFALGSTMADRMVAFNRKFRTETSSEFNWV
ncbi:MAG: cyclic nucleotide-binding domain-containing protein [Verrucomicrobiota bacterium]|jgi:hypothetical protein|nr:cyclic nucleotide-binding domain-containing protein [Verrucomicrobiota bacterium]|tara:strand:- start:1715 stop:2482 length:768 start_codon:yes stop_codon:yes gene_type:complete